MADVVSVGCLLFLLINTSTGGLPGLADLDDGSSKSNDKGADIQLLNEPISINKMMVHQPRYKCHQCDPPDCEEIGPEICEGALYCYKSSVREPGGTVRHSRGCSTHREHYQFTCWTQREPLKKRHLSQLNVTCCRGDLCNDGDFPALPLQPDTSIEPVPSNSWKLWVTVVASILIVIAVGAMAIFVLRRSHKLRVSRAALDKLGNKVERSYYPTNVYPHLTTAPYYEGSVGSGGTGATERLRATAAGDSTLRQFLEQSASSGSGGGLPLMAQLTLARRITASRQVGKGRFGEVWRGTYNGDTVAIKIFFSRDEASWRRETEIYSTILLRHDNILAYVGSDMTSRNSCTQLWLITAYHPYGSLYEYLNSRARPTRAHAVLMMLSCVRGLLHLHTEIHGTQGKPAIAHRDIKSKNILVKSDGSCCIADLGLAVTSNDLSVASPRQGTSRYMPPEMLDNTMDTSCFESYRRGDMYSMALVLWEISWVAAGKEYRMPYQEHVPSDPSFHDMRKIVCNEGIRPHCLGSTDEWSLMKECWHARSAVRLPALRLKKSLLKIAATVPGCENIE